MTNFIDEQSLGRLIIQNGNPDSQTVAQILSKAAEKKGLGTNEIAVLVNLKDQALIQELFQTAAQIKQEIYGERLVFFAPLYVSNFCVNNCQYCNFHSSNINLSRIKLTQSEIEEQVKILINMGHKRLLLEFGEDEKENPIDYVIETIKTIYKIKNAKGNIRRVNINIAATSVENYKKLKTANIGTYQLFQETYHRPTYEKLHAGPKANYDRQLNAPSIAFEAGIDDLGLGVLFGLYDWRFEILALISHAKHLEQTTGVGPHTISVPRLCPAPSVTYSPEYPVSDEDFLKLIAIIRLAVPYTGMIISTRETPQVRSQAFKIGISQASAASRTSIGGYDRNDSAGQFEGHDTRSLEEVINSALDDKLLPSFCTACYRMSRTGEHFMSLTKPGKIHNFCRPNGLLTFSEYLEDFASTKFKKKGYQVIDFYLSQIDDLETRELTSEKLQQIKTGHRDLYF
jgi:2-iminoacetate synthase